VAENVQADGGDLFRIVRSFGVTAYVCHPLIVADRLFGTLAFGLRGRTAFEDHELDLLKALADQLAVAIHRAGVLKSEQRARMEAEAASKAKSAFMATLSHELRTPLNATIGYADLLADGIPEPLPVGSRRHVDRIRVASHHLLQLIEELLTFSRLEAGRELCWIENVLVSDLINEVRVVAEPLAATAGLSFDIDTANAPRIVATDPRKLRQILLNLIGNAVKFTTEGTVTLTVCQDAGDVLFVVTDTGMGIAPENHARLFEPFWQVDSSKTRQSAGTGLGLTISRKYAELLGGNVTVQSAPGEGSVFTLRLPFLTE
jgi:signal transduction histidine kinase